MGMNRLIFMTFLVGLFLASQPAAAEDLVVASSVVQDRKSVFATVETADVVPARTQIGGTIGELLVDEGTEVEEGALVARIVDAKLGLRIESLAARIQSLSSQKKLAETTLERARQLQASGTIPQAKLEEAETNREVADRQLRAVEAERKVILEQQSEGAVLAPSAGRVLKVQVTRGTVVLPGETVATIAAKGYLLRMRLPERHARFLRIGDEVRVGRRDLTGAVDALPTDAPKGRIVQVYPEMRQGRVVADVEADRLGDYFIGERVSVLVATGSRTALVVPEPYLFRRFGVTFVRLKTGAEVVVQPGLAADGGIEVLSGLRAGDVLVLPEDGR